MHKILIYNGDAQILKEFKKYANKKNIKIEVISKFRDLLNNVTPKKFIAIVIEFKKKSLEGEISNVGLIQIIKKMDPDLPIIVTSEKSSFDSEKEIRTAGIFFYMVKPYNPFEIHSILDEVMIKSKSTQ